MCARLPLAALACAEDGSGEVGRGGLLLTGQVQLHTTVVNHGGIDLAADNLEAGHSEHGGLLLPLVLIGPFPEGILGKNIPRN